MKQKGNPQTKDDFSWFNNGDGDGGPDHPNEAPVFEKELNGTHADTLSERGGERRTMEKPKPELKVELQKPKEVPPEPQKEPVQPVAVKTASKTSSAIYDAKIHKYIPEKDKISLRKRKPVKEIIEKPVLRSSSGESNSDSDDDAVKTTAKKTESSGPKNKLLVLMMMLFEGSDLTLDLIESLSREEKYILSSLVLRKFNIKMQPTASSSQIVHSINSQRELSKAKRLEENYKLVFKKALKFLLKKFKKTNDIRGKKCELELQFYKFYFEEVFKRDRLEEEMGINNDGKNFKGQTLFNPKTINSRYVSNIMKSQIFQSHFEDFLENQFITDYNKTREFKIQKVVEKCYECYNKKKGGGFEEVQRYIEQNPKCKLPWSNNELVSARESVKQLLINKLKREEQEREKDKGVPGQNS
jgi:hypothetical protein